MASHAQSSKSLIPYDNSGTALIRVKYVPYSYTVKTNNEYEWNKVTYSIVEGELAEGLQMYPDTGEDCTCYRRQFKCCHYIIWCIYRIQISAFSKHIRSICYFTSISNFDTSSVLDMELMFQNCESLVSLDLSSFNTSNVKDMYSMFAWNRSLNSVNLSSFDGGCRNDLRGSTYITSGN